MGNFSKILIANRGEVAVRLIRACRELNIATVAVYSDADRCAMHAELADEAIHIGSSPALESYLNQEKLLDAARLTRADAIHPGFGFLAESAGFARRCKQAGVVFIGPEATTMELMASKSEARRRVQKLGIPVIPGSSDPDQDPVELERIANTIGYPVLIKASAGGGGLGIRAVHGQAEFEESLKAVRREARAAFGDEHVMLEKFLANVRHIEVQVIADVHGQVLHCYERECSLQRRRQKVIEEAPSASLNDGLRKQMTDAAMAIARDVSYVGLGTVEFVVSRRTGDFYFLEMNTRLQVEHGITEAVTGLDLVKTQIQVAEGKPLGFAQQDIAIEGHAIECRLYAEDPSAGFAPAAGVVRHFEPGPVSGLRVDSGIHHGSEITSWYDPMLAKLIVHDRNRNAAIRGMERCLNDTRILGLTTNQHLLASLIRQPAYRSDEISTTFIEENLESLLKPAAGKAFERLILAASAHRATLQKLGQSGAAPSRLTIRLVCQDQEHEVRLSAGVSGSFVGELDGGRHVIQVLDSRPGERELRVEIDGHTQAYTIFSNDAEVFIHAAGLGSHRMQVLSRFAHHSGVALTGGYVASLPGLVLEVRVKEGDVVRAGDTLIVLESMKMEHRVLAAADGVVGNLAVRESDVVARNARLVDVGPLDQCAE